MYNSRDSLCITEHLGTIQRRYVGRHLAKRCDVKAGGTIKRNNVTTGGTVAYSLLRKDHRFHRLSSCTTGRIHQTYAGTCPSAVGTLIEEE
jgi:hypothetical protein